MSERGQFRGAARGSRGNHRGDRNDHHNDHRGGRGGGGRGGGRGGHGGHHNEEREPRKKENILDLSKYMDKEISVKFNGGREVTGTLKGFDQLMNLVLDDVKEVMRDEHSNTTTRHLGLVVARGTLLTVLSPVDGSEEIVNPYGAEEEE